MINTLKDRTKVGGIVRGNAPLQSQLGVARAPAAPLLPVPLRQTDRCSRTHYQAAFADGNDIEGRTHANRQVFALSTLILAR